MARWLFAPALLLAGIALGIAAFFGLKTFYDARSSVDAAAGTAIKALQRTTQEAQDSIRNKVSDAQKRVDEYAAAPGLRKALHDSEAAVLQANRRTEAVVEMAAQDEEKLAAIDAARKAHPKLTLDGLDASLVTPLSSSVGHYYSVGDTGPDVGDIQAHLKVLGCYTGDITGNYDQSTADAIIRYKTWHNSRLYTFDRSGSLSSSNMPSATLLLGLPILMYHSVDRDGQADFITSNALSLDALDPSLAGKCKSGP